MGDQMNKNPTEDELDVVVERFLNTYKDFEKAAKNPMSIMDSMNKQKYQELKALSEETQQTHDFLVQIMYDSGQIGENCFDIRCVAEKEKKQEQKL